EEKDMFLEELGIEQSGLDQLIKTSYELLGLGTYFTAGEQEVRAWTFKKGMTAPQAAGIIHTDFERGFIRAETVSYTDLMEAGCMAKARENGKVRLEGKEYIVQDGDVIHFRFNVYRKRCYKLYIEKVFDKIINCWYLYYIIIALDLRVYINT